MKMSLDSDASQTYSTHQIYIYVHACAKFFREGFDTRQNLDLHTEKIHVPNSLS